MRRIAIASYTDGSPGQRPLPSGDILLRQALEQAGHQAHQVIWSCPQVEWAAFDAVVVRSCWDYHLQPQAFLDWLAQRQMPVVNSPALICWNLNKRYLIELERRGIAIAETVWLEDGKTFDVTGKKRVVKPLISASAHQTRVLSEGVVHGPAMVQEFIEEVATQGEWSLMYFDGSFSHAVLKKPAAGDFRVQQDYGGSAVPSDPPAEAREFSERVLAGAPHAAALARVDMVLSARGPLLMELEVIEPELFLPPDGRAAALAAQTILRNLY